jgi:MerR family transcriptional regulator, light-induced transcriptional regulator
MNEASEFRHPRYPVRLVALRTGLSPHVLRAWERRYQVVAPSRTSGGQRLYSDLDVERLRRLRRLTDRGHAIGRLAGLPLDELIRLDETPAGAEEPPAPESGRTESVRVYVEASLRAARRFDAAELQALLERAAVTLGVPLFLEEVVAPTVDRIGHGWADGTVSVAQEHMATAVVRRVLGWLLGVYEVHGEAPRLVVATPTRQVHELGALLVAVSAAAEGWRVAYLGPDLPAADLVTAVRVTEASAVALSVVYASDDSVLVEALRETRAGLPDDVPLVIGGAASPQIRREVEAIGALVVDRLPEFRSLLRRLAVSDRSRAAEAPDRAAQRASPAPQSPR